MIDVEIAAILHRAIGLEPSTIGPGIAQRTIEAHMKRLGLPTAEAYRACLRSSPEELQELIESLVVQETWFFRDPDAFVTLAALVISRRRNDNVRILSVPCSTGEEPYSIAMALADTGVPLSRVAIDAVDVSARALKRAEAAMYPPNSFRGSNLGYRERYFRPVPGGFRLDDATRAAVRFHQGALPRLPLEVAQRRYDAIFCKNLFIYCDEPSRKAIVTALTCVLADKGTLFVAAAEAPLISGGDWRAIEPIAASAFQRGERRKASGEISAPPSLAKMTPPARPAMRAATPAARPRVAPQPPPPARPPSVRPPSLADARRLADVGRLREAEEICQAHLKANGDLADAHFLLGLIRDAQGDADCAVESYKRTLYLDPEHVEALMHLASVMSKRGERASAERLLARARRAEAERRSR
ncbi:MAG: hypothetical protein HOW73_21495 [Polyangiaceae bacterium]|nr:hypothetical protein [Polyangiaceae bacterium]